MHSHTVEDNLGLVWNVIHKFFGGGNNHKFLGFERDDLFQLGCIGLMKAVDRFDEDKGEFPTYAFNCIYGEIRKEIRDNGRMVKFPRTCHEIVAKIVKQDRKFSINIDEVTAEFGITNKYAQMVMACLHYSSVSGSKVIGDDDGRETTMLEILEDEEVNVEMDAVNSIELERRLSVLTDKEKEIVELGLKGLTQQEIADMIGISQMHVSRTLKKSIEKIQNRFDNALLV
jgi:RNA polymerase sporulation-specific sigma factor